MIVNNKYQISWAHNNEEAKVFLSNSELREAAKEIILTNNSRTSSLEAIDKLLVSQEEFRRSFSKCFIENLETHEKVEGIGIVHPCDHFNRKKGMEVSFKDAVSKIHSLSVRKLLWREFLKNYKKSVRLKETISINTKINPNANSSKYSLG